MEHITIGILAHVDAGKTTLSEGFLFSAGIIKQTGRVDKGDTFLDNNRLERKRGITIFSKQAEMTAFGKKITLLDTPGHTDLRAETERTLSVLDYAVFLISATEGLRAHSMTLWRLLKKYGIPTFLFVNKMDSTERSEEDLLRDIRQKLGSSVIKMDGDGIGEDVLEDIAVLDEAVMDRYLETGRIEKSDIRMLIARRRLFPCHFGSALRGEGVEELLYALSNYSLMKNFGKEFGGRVYKITEDMTGTRLVHLKVTGGKLAVKSTIRGEKIDEIRIYNGEKYETREVAEAGEICAVTGLHGLSAGEGIGTEEGKMIQPSEMPVMRYRLILPENTDERSFFPKLLALTEEIPELRAGFGEETKEITLSLTGEVQKEVLTDLISSKYGIGVSFGEGRILYKETIRGEAVGVGHFEPLRHYAEVQLLLREGERGSGLVFEADIAEEELAANWRKAILAHLEEKEHKGVLTGSPITDLKITLLAGKAHLKHTEGGDFRQAVYRAVRNGLMKANSVLLEPIFTFRLEVPEKAIGRAMADMSAMNGTFGVPETVKGLSVLTGKVPVSCLKDYELTLRSYTSGEGRLFLEPSEYAPCHNAEEVIERLSYYPEADTENTADSVFCSHGAGFVVPWNEVEAYMHLPLKRKAEGDRTEIEEGEVFREYARRAERQTGSKKEEIFLGREEIDRILQNATAGNKKKEEESKRNRWKKKKVETGEALNGEYKTTSKGRIHTGKDYLLVDGYNIIFAWEELKTLALANIDGARDKLIEKMGNYQGYKGCDVILVFDAYKVKGGQENILKYGGLTVIYTKEAETADQYIAKASDALKKEGRVTVATSDAMVQMIIFGSGAIRLSAKDLEREVLFTEEKMREEHREILKKE